MKKRITVLAAFCLFVSSQAWADTVYTFNDSWIDWPGYTSDLSHKDEHGNPRIDNLSVTLSDTGKLRSVDIALHSTPTWIEFNSLFINSHAITSNTTQWDDWDYFVHDGGLSNAGYTQGGRQSVPGNGIYTVNPGGYEYSLTVDSDRVRNDSPNGIQKSDLSLIDNYDGRGWERSGYDPYLISYSFEGIDGLDIDLSYGFSIAFAPYCANDVIGGSMHGMNPVPEPTTLALVGLGLLGVAGMGRRRQQR
ncbi:MAG: PEP-CTERM sorting domain-containing protein [Desulfobacter sp.]